MLRRLQVSNYVLIDSLDITFPEGLVIITGQTGAGKSILLGSISLVLGAKADPSIIGESSDKCIVEAEFDVPASNMSIRSILDENDVEWDDGHLILRRVVGRSGRPRSFVNDCPVAASVLSSLSSELIDIHSQHQTLLLSDHRFQLSALDHFAGNGDLLQQCASEYRIYQELQSELGNIDARLKKMAGERDYDQARLSQLESASLRDGELEELEAEQKQLANAEDIKDNLYAVETLMSSDQEEDGRLSMDAMLRESIKRLEKVSQYLPSVSQMTERLESARVELDDILSGITDLDSKIEVSQDRLNEVESRLSLLYGLLQKFSCRDIAGLISVRDGLRAVLHDSTDLEEKRIQIEKDLEASKTRLDRVAEQLHKSRTDAAPAFSESIQDSIHFLELQYAVFDVDIQETQVSQTGKDAVVFRFSSTGKNPVELSKCASGGELSRIMLCLKDMMARYTNMPTMIFDEIDTGVSGSVADKMGSMICRMGENMQVFAITHLPQVAAKGQAHYLVTKSVGQTDGKTVTTIRKLSQEDRVLELARMLSGAEITQAAIANARSLLSI